VTPRRRSPLLNAALPGCKSPTMAFFPRRGTP